MRWRQSTLRAGCLALVVVACSPNNATTTTTVPWKDYEPGLQAKIDAMAVAKDCDGMQEQFNSIGGTNLAVRERTGHGNEEILQYIDDKEHDAKCL